MAKTPSKKNKLLEAAKASTPTPDSGKHQAFVNREIGFKKRSVSLNPGEDDFIAYIDGIIKDASGRRQNFSFVVQRAVQCLKNELDGKSSDEIVSYLERPPKKIT